MVARSNPTPNPNPNPDPSPNPNPDPHPNPNQVLMVARGGDGGYVEVGTTNYYSLLLTTAHYCSLLLTTAHYCSLLLTTAHYYSLLLTTTHYYYSLCGGGATRDAPRAPCDPTTLRGELVSSTLVVSKLVS